MKTIENKKAEWKKSEPELKLINMESVKVEQIEWLLYPFIPFGKVTIIQGDPGEGKTTMVLQIIAKLTRGEPILLNKKSQKEAQQDSEENLKQEVLSQDNPIQPVNVIYQTAEDGLGDTIKPRLLAAGADCSRVLVIDDREQPLTMVDVRLEEAIMQTKARMVVLDPIQGFLGTDVDMHRANEIRPLMKRVAVLAEKYHCAIILIGHMNKNSNGKSSYRGLGSIDFQAAARSVLIVGRLKDEPETRVMCHVKSSLAPEGKSVAFRLDKETGFQWIGEYDISADDLLSGDARGQKSRIAKEFLLDILADGGMAQKKIEEEASKQGIKKKTLRNAKQELEIDSVKRGNQWFWILSE
nr:AAA family ATPase [Lachnoclostridium phocaeense]